MMKSPIQLPRVRARVALALLVAAALGIDAAHGTGVDVTPFVGNWTFESGSRVQVLCSGLSISTDVQYSVSVSAGTSSDLEFHLACHCTLPLNIVGAQARLAAPTPCSFLMVSTQIVTTVTDLTFDLSSPVPSVIITGTDGEGLARPPTIPGTGLCSSFGISGTVHRDSTTPGDCGPDDTAVGILPSWTDGNIDCGIGVGREGVDILLNSNNSLACLSETGARGEGKWVLPQAERYDQVCKAVSATATSTPNLVDLPFCRVDGNQFKPMTTDPTATDQFYAVLMMGTRCPNGSVEVVWQLDTPDVNDASSCAGAAPDTPCGPNQAVNLGAGASTFFMHFCFFRSAASEDGVMTSFPEVGKAYAVFHDFGGGQPPWVILKRWLYSQHGMGNRLSGADAGANRQFSTLVEETSDHGIYFEMARVR